MAYQSPISKSEVAHHAGEALSKNVTAALKSFLTTLTTFRAFKTIQKLLELVDVKKVISSTLSGGYATSHWMLNQKLLIMLERPCAKILRRLSKPS